MESVKQHIQNNVEPITEADIVSRFKATLLEYNAGPFAHYLPYTPQTQPILDSLAAPEPKTLLPVHGSAYSGDGAKAIRDMSVMLRETIG